MKKIVLLLAMSSQLSAAQLEVTISGIQEQTGALYIAAFDSAEAMQKGQQWLSMVRVVNADSYRFIETDLKPGKYAFRVFHDVNGDGDLNMNLMGIPTEPYGFSKNPVVMGPPSFEQSAVEVSAEEISIEIKLQ